MYFYKTNKTSPTKTERKLSCSECLRIFCSTNGNRRVTRFTNPVISHEEGRKEGRKEGREEGRKEL